MIFGPQAIDGNAVAAFAHGALGAAERRVAGIGVNILPGAVVRGPEDVGVLVEAERADLVHDPADPRVVLDEGIGVLALGHGFVDRSRGAACSAGAPS